MQFAIAIYCLPTKDTGGLLEFLLPSTNQHYLEISAIGIEFLFQIKLIKILEDNAFIRLILESATKIEIKTSKQMEFNKQQHSVNVKDVISKFNKLISNKNYKAISIEGKTRPNKQAQSQYYAIKLSLQQKQLIQTAKFSVDKIK
ncbi:UNKNOWN [Stylonychia lemnae]|uniref:Uncharacterized protein n=1 Tax=Stylonychia lemnae TaxID=5949 RepID=A0A077ZSX1_STYLE|nr:UNKNOWN [Stylonychia lemnae]|eukprot:CDW72410.1 UNKNOWN [Stylonychia lemnae]